MHLSCAFAATIWTVCVTASHFFFCSDKSVSAARTKHVLQLLKDTLRWIAMWFIYSSERHKYNSLIMISLCFWIIELILKKKALKIQSLVLRNTETLTWRLMKLWLVNLISQLLSPSFRMFWNHHSCTWTRDGVISGTKTNAVISSQWSVCRGPSGDCKPRCW